MESSIPEEREAEGRLGVGVWGAKPPNGGDPLYLLFMPVRLNRYPTPKCGGLNALDEFETLDANSNCVLLAFRAFETKNMQRELRTPSA